jgi:hypothetical protein
VDFINAFSNASMPALLSAESRTLPPHCLQINPTRVIVHGNASLLLPQEPAQFGYDPLVTLLLTKQGLQGTWYKKTTFHFYFDIVIYSFSIK